MKLSDLTNVMQIEKEAFTMPWTEDFFRELLKEQKCLVGIFNGELVSYIVGATYPDVFYILNLAVKREYRGKGFGESILRYTLKLMTEQKYKIFMLDVRESNTKALALYSKLRFYQYSVKKDYYEKPKENSIQMVLFTGNLL